MWKKSCLAYAAAAAAASASVPKHGHRWFANENFDRVYKAFTRLRSGNKVEAPWSLLCDIILLRGSTAVTKAP